MSRSTLGVCLVVGWMLMWGDIGVGTVVGGSLVAFALFVVFPSSRPVRPRVVVHPFAVLRLAAYFVGQLLVSNLLLSRELFRRRPVLEGRVVEVPMRTTSPSLLTMVINLAALTPGTMVVTADDAAPSVTVHVLMFDDGDDPSATIAQLRRLEELSVMAFGTKEAIAELSSAEARAPEVGRP